MSSASGSLAAKFRLFLRSLGFAWEGISYAFSHHQSFQIEAVAGALVVFLGVWFKISWIEWLVLIFVMAQVLTAELLNTSIESTLDYVADEHHIKVKIAKDVAAGAVLAASIGAMVIGLLIFAPRLF